MSRILSCCCLSWPRRGGLWLLFLLLLEGGGCQQSVTWSSFLFPAPPVTSQTGGSTGSAGQASGQGKEVLPVESWPAQMQAKGIGTTLVPPLGMAVPTAMVKESLVIGENENSLAPQVANTSRRIALLLPLSGNAASIGQALSNSAQMALFEIAGPDLVLQLYDTQGTPEGAAQAADLALAQGVRLIIGPLFSSEAKVVGPKAQLLNVNVVAFASDPAIAANGVFIIGHQLRQQVERVVLFARSRGLSIFAALAPDDAYGRQAVTALQTAAAAADGRVTAVEFYDPATADLILVVRRLAQQKPFDAVLIPDRGDRLKRVTPLLSYFDIDLRDTRLLGTQRWMEGSLHQEPAVIGSWYAVPSSPAQAQFVARYRGAFATNPPAISSLAYDAVALAAVLARGGSPNFDSDAMTNEAGFAGVDGLFRLRSSGVAERGLAVMEVKTDGNSTIVSPPPEAFDRPGS